MRDVALARAVQVASAVAFGGGLVLAMAPLPLSAYGCTSAVHADLGDAADLAPACGQQRTDRQDLVAGLLVGSLAAAGGAETYVRRVRRDEDDRHRP